MSGGRRGPAGREVQSVSPGFVTVDAVTRPIVRGGRRQLAGRASAPLAVRFNTMPDNELGEALPTRVPRHLGMQKLPAGNSCRLDGPASATGTKKCDGLLAHRTPVPLPIGLPPAVSARWALPGVSSAC